MTATFNPALSTLKDHIRLALGDVDAAAMLLLDETILAKLAAVGYGEALAQCAEALLVLLATEPDVYEEHGGVHVGIHVEFRQRIPALQQLIHAARSGKIHPPVLFTPANLRRVLAVAPTAEQAGESGSMLKFRSK